MISEPGVFSFLSERRGEKGWDGAFVLIIRRNGDI